MQHFICAKQSLYRNTIVQGKLMHSPYFFLTKTYRSVRHQRPLHSRHHRPQVWRSRPHHSIRAPAFHLPREGPTLPPRLLPRPANQVNWFTWRGRPAEGSNICLSPRSGPTVRCWEYSRPLAAPADRGAHCRSESEGDGLSAAVPGQWGEQESCASLDRGLWGACSGAGVFLSLWRPEL